jgi:hypothetical protein
MASDNTIIYTHYHEYTEDGRDMLAEIEFEATFKVEPSEPTTFWSPGCGATIEEIAFRLVSVKITDCDDDDDEGQVVPADELGTTIRKTLTQTFDRLYDVCQETREAVDRECLRHNEVMIGPD